MHTSIRKSQQDNYNASRRADFPHWVGREIFRQRVRCLRVHVAGDFYAADYTRKWVQVFRRYAGVHYYAYTRSWRDPEIRAILAQAAMQLPHFQLWWSCDRSMPEPPRDPGVRRAYMQVAADDVPAYPIDLVFRVSPLRRRPARTAGNALVCPAENGITKTTCERCLVCVVPDTPEQRAAARRRLYALAMV